MELGDSIAPRTVDIPDSVWRVALIPSGQRFSEIAPDDALLRDAGNRFDVPGGGVLYCATTPRGSYLETLTPADLCHPTTSRRDERRLFTVDTTNPASLAPERGFPPKWRPSSAMAYSSLDEEGIYNYSGIRYVSKLDNEECWAVFSGTETFIHEQTTIENTDPDLLDVARLFALTIH